MAISQPTTKTTFASKSKEKKPVKGMKMGERSPSEKQLPAKKPSKK